MSKTLKPKLDRIVEAVDANPEAAGAALRAIANRIDILMAEHPDDVDRAVVWSAVWALVVDLKHHADLAAHRKAA